VTIYLKKTFTQNELTILLKEIVFKNIDIATPFKPEDITIDWSNFVGVEESKRVLVVLLTKQDLQYRIER